LQKNSYKKLYNVDPKVGAIHAGLETGAIGSKFSEIDMISIGTTSHNGHSPDEKVVIKDVDPFYRFIQQTLNGIDVFESWESLS